MYAAMLVRVGSEVLHSVMGGFALFNFYYAAQLTNPDLVETLFANGLKWGVLAVIIVYFKERYLQS